MIPPKSGRLPAAPLALTVVRELTHADIARLVSEEVERSAAPVLQRLRAPHHAAARLLAAGKNIKEVAILVNRTPQRIGDLLKDRLFNDLVEYYRDQITTADIQDAARLNRKLNTLAEDAVDELQERMDDAERRKALPVRDVIEISKMGLDRTTNPPKTAMPLVSVPQNITFNIAGTIDRTKPVPEIEAKTIEHETESHETEIQPTEGASQTPESDDNGLEPESDPKRETVRTETPAKGE